MPPKSLEKHDKEIQAIFTAIRQLMATPEKPKWRIGFHENSQAKGLKQQIRVLK